MPVELGSLAQPLQIAMSALLYCGATWRGGRVVECSGLENRRARKGTVSSNLTRAVRMRSFWSRIALAAIF